MGDTRDPYEMVKEEVQRTVDGIGGIFSRWQQLLKNTNTAETDEFEFTTRELTEHLGSIEDDLKALEETVGLVEMNKERFHLEDSDIMQRKRFISDVRQKVIDIRSEMDSPKTRQKISHDQRAVLLSGNQHSAPHINEARNLRGNLIIANEQEEQKLLMAQQDDVLDEIHEGAKNLHEVSINMNTELKSQIGMLEEVNQQTGDLHTRLNAANNKVNDLIETSMSFKSRCMIMSFLAATFVVLTFLVFYT